MNTQKIAHVGFQDVDEALQIYFSDSTVRFIQAKVRELLTPFYPPGVLVPYDKIENVMNSVYRGFRPATGDIFTRYSIPSTENTNAIDEMINQVVQIICTDVQNNLTTEQNNAKLDIFNTVLGDGNPLGVRQTPPLKVRQKRPNFIINMNY